MTDHRNQLNFARLDLDAATRSFDNRPVAQFDQSSYSVNVRKDKQFSAFESSDPNGAALTYNWNFGDGSGLLQSASPTISYNYDHVGRYDISLSVFNGTNNSETVWAKATVYDPAIVSVVTSAVLF